MKTDSFQSQGAPLRFIVISPSGEEALRLAASLERAGRSCEWARVEHRDAFLQCAARFPCDAVLYDDALPEEAHLPAADAFLLLREHDGTTPLLILSSRSDPEAALEALQAGAADWVPKSDLGRLPAAMARALRETRLRRDRRRSDDAARLAEEKLRALLDQSPDVVLVVQGVTGTILRANAASARLLGRDEAELAGKHFSVLLPPEAGAEKLLERLRAAADAHEAGPAVLSQPFRRAAGGDLPMDVLACPLPWGSTRALLCTLRDVAARDAAEEALRRAEFILDRAAGPVIWTDAAGRIGGATPAACALLGYPPGGPGGVAGLAIDAVEPGMGGALWTIHWEELRAYGSFRSATALRRRDGSTLRAEAQVSLFVHQGREWRCAVLQEAPDAGHGAPDTGLGPHDTEARRVLVDQLARHAPDVTARLDERGTIVDFVGAATALLGEGEASRAALAAAPGTLLASWAHPADAPAVAAALERCRREPHRPVRVSWRAERPGGGTLALETVFVNRLADPALRGFLAASRDVTERRLAEDHLLRLAQELERANDDLRRAAAHRDEFLAGWGGTLRAPLQAVLDAADAGRTGGDARASLRALREEGERLLAQLDALHDLARAEAGQLELTWEAVDAAEACGAAVEPMREKARRKGLDLAVSGIGARAGRRAAPTLRADPRRLRQILHILLANAVAFTPEGGGVRLEMEWDEARQTVLFHVVDTGIGIDPADVPRLFRPFVPLVSLVSQIPQAPPVSPAGDEAGKRRLSEGPGIGLALAGRLAHLHGGTIHVESALGRGSRFTVVLPAGLSSVASGASPAFQPSET